MTVVSHRRLVATATGFVISLAGLVGAPAAHAAAGDEIVYGLADGTLHVLDTVTHDDTVLAGITPTGSVTHPFSSIAVSRDATKIAWVDATTTGSQLRVYDRASSTTSTVYGAATGDLGRPAWLPDGSGLVVQRFAASGSGVIVPTGGLMVVSVDGTTAAIPGTDGASSPDLSPGGGQVLFSAWSGGGWRVFMVNVDGTGRYDLGITGRVPRWAHDGRHLLVTVDAYAPDGTDVGSLAVTYDLRGDHKVLLEPTFRTVTDWSARTMASSWSPDGSSVLTVLPGAVSSGSGVEIASSSGSGPADPALAEGTAVTDAAWAGPWSVLDSTAPFPIPPVVSLMASGVSVTTGGFAVEDPDGVGIRIAVAEGLTAPSTFQAATWKTSILGIRGSATITGLVAGRTYSYRIWAFDASGNESPSDQKHFRLLSAPVLTVPAVASTGSVGGYIPVSWTSPSPGTADAIVASGSYSVTPFGGVTEAIPTVGAGRPASGSLLFGKSGVPKVLQPGTLYLFRAGARDAWGNVAWSPIRSSAYPYDDRSTSLRYVGSWSKASTTGAWNGTTTGTSSGGSVSMTMPQINFSAKKFSVVATTSKLGGSFKVYVDGIYQRTVSTRSTVTALRRVVWASGTLTSHSHKLTIVQVKGSGLIRLDAVGVTLGA